MINKYRIKIVQKELYNVRDPSWVKDRKNYRRNYCSNLNGICNCLQLIYTITNLLGPDREWIYSYQSFWLLFDYLSNLFYPLSNSLESSSSIHPLQICCVVLTRPISVYILGLDFKTCPYIYIYIYIYQTPCIWGVWLCITEVSIIRRLWFYVLFSSSFTQALPIILCSWCMFGCILLAIAHMLIAENSFKYICLLITKKKKTNKQRERGRPKTLKRCT